MSLAVLALIAWVVIYGFTAIPKGLTLSEMVFLYFLLGIMTITLFTVLDVNLHRVPVTQKWEGSFAMYICRFVVIPILLLTAICMLNQAHWKAVRRWAWTAAVLLFLCIADRIYLWLGLMEYRRWNEWYSAVMYGAFLLISWRVGRWFVRLDRGGFKKS